MILKENILDFLQSKPIRPYFFKKMRSVSRIISIFAAANEKPL